MIINDDTKLTAEQIKAEYLKQINSPVVVPTVYRRTLPDGRVVEAESLELLTDKLADIAAASASAASATVSAATATPTEEEQAAARLAESDREFVLSQRFASNPSQALAESLGFSTIAEAKAALAKVRDQAASEAANLAAEQFVAQTPEYAAIPYNGALIQSYMGNNKDADRLSHAKGQAQNLAFSSMTTW